jgi:hypothetical protein
VGQKAPLTEMMARTVGGLLGLHGGTGGAIATSQAAGALIRLRNSTLWNSFSAATKGKLAEMAADGDVNGMFGVVASAANPSGRIESPAAESVQ